MRSHAIRKTALYLAGFLVFVGVWWGGSYLAGPEVLPPPSDIAAYIADQGVVLRFLGDIALTLGRGFLGFSLAWVVGIPAGFLMGRSDAGERIGFFPLFLLQSAPPLLWITPLILWLGTRGHVAPVVAFLVSLPLLTVHTMMAVKHIPDYEYDVFRVYAPRASVIARELYLPHLLPAMKSNLHLGFLVAVKAAMLAEWFAAQNGFGQTIRIHYQFFAMTEFLSWALLFLIVVGGLSLAIRAALTRWLPQYRPTATATGSPRRRDVRATRDRREPASGAPAGAGIRVRDLTFSYERVPVFEGLSLEVSAQRPTVLFGESACGKTTLLKCVSGLLRARKGSIDAPGRVGLVFQEDALLSHRDSLGNVLLPDMPGYSKTDIDEARHCLELWGLDREGRQFPHELSGGMRKRLAMARAWYLKPDVLLLDEPFVNLDREARQALWKLLFLRLEERRMTSLIVTHYPEELEAFTIDLKSWTSLLL